MIPVLTRAEMANIDKAVASSYEGIGFEYMQRAARGLFDLVINRYLESQKKGQNAFVTIFAGKGNNGGDGILLAAYLAEEGYPVKCFILGSVSELKNEARHAYLELERGNNKNEYLDFIEDIADIELVQKHFGKISSKYNKHFFIDALLGIGAKGKPQEPAASLIRIINEYYTSVDTISVDLPSGSDVDTGEINVACVRAHSTLTMGYPKLGSFFFPARANYGLTIVQNLSYPIEIFEHEFKSKIYFANTVKQLLPPRIATGSKYDHGFATLIAGSPGMEGAASLAGTAAYKSGLGLLKILTDAQTRKIVASNLLEAISEDIVDDLLKQACVKNPAVLGLGPGLSLAYKDQITSLIKSYNAPMILDADAINSLDTKLLKKHKSDLLITPHAGEYTRLFGKFDKSLTPMELIEDLRAKAQEYQMTILYKGAPTIIADPGGKVFLVPFGNSGLATAGTGDVLTGLTLGFATQLYTLHARYPEIRFFYTVFEISPLTQAAILASFIHAKAGEKASKELTEYSVMASDLLKYIPKVIGEL
ncbi:MAG: NAD(P)H-hydrate dehydratase [Cyanobacteria bacterium]|nr:NAD(P)H-hydrate dehydratase [Cyanobacteriota bacterium]